MIIKEIQGLRAISLLLVLFYHLKLSGFELGYLGVDIFFVISGFIFSKIILENLESNKFNFFKYLKNRIIRLLPALLSTFFISTIFFWIVLTPNELEYFGQSLFSSSLFLSNFYYYAINFDYFAPSNYPLIHLWSLSLEVQFYLLLPLFYYFIFYFKLKKNMKHIVLFVFIFSFLMNIFFSNYQTLIFYLLPFRIWEFLLGYFIYDLTKKYDKKSLFKRSEFFLIGGLFLFYLIFGAEQSIKYQIITLLVFFIIFFYSYEKKNFLNRFLNSKYNQIISERSYSIFLIHYPVIFFIDYLLTSEFYINLLIIKLISILFFTEIIFKIESYYFKVGKKTKYKLNYRFVAILSSTFIILGFVFYETKGSQYRYLLNKDLKQNYYSYIYNKKIQNSTAFNSCNKLCKKIVSHKKTILLIGDSHAKDFEDAFYALSIEKKMNLFTLYELNNKHSDSSIYNNSQLTKLSKTLENNNIDFVYLAHHLRNIKPELYFQRLNEIIKDNPKIIFIYFKPRLEFNISPIKYMTLKFLNLEINDQMLEDPLAVFFVTLFNSEENKYQSIKKKDNLIIIDQNKLLLEFSSPRCESRECFDGHDKNFIPLYRDLHHLTNYAAELILDKIERSKYISKVSLLNTISSNK